MGVTSKEVLSRLKQSGRHQFTERQLTDFRGKQLLPPLQRFNQPGSRKPLYLWDESAIAQAAYLHDLLQWDHQHDRLYIPLWLAGFDIPERAIRRLTLRFIERHLSRLTQGETDPEEILDLVSTLVSERLIPKWKYSPKKHEMIRSIGVQTWAEIVECVFDFLAVPFYEPDIELLVNLIPQLVCLQKDNQSNVPTDPESVYRAANAFLELLKLLSPLFSIPQLKEAVEQATSEEWTQARHYYQKLHSMANFLLEGLNPYMVEPFPEAFYYQVSMNGALYLLPSFLSLIRHSHNDLLGKAENYLRGLLTLLEDYGWSQKHPQEVLSAITLQHQAKEKAENLVEPEQK